MKLLLWLICQLRHRKWHFTGKLDGKRKCLICLLRNAPFPATTVISGNSNHGKSTFGLN